ncbi:hypothetical protein F4804DRAFT_301852 [Jackrogersella minutella]|nr:hypothetical protein F4804DRAFT_301852 [Jackrogersella minutella]
MYNLLSLVLASASLLQSVSAKPVADVLEIRGVGPRDVELVEPRYSHRPRGAMIKRDADKTFDLGFEANDVTLFSGDWTTSNTTFSLTLACVECRTWGTLMASAEFPDNLEELIGDFSDGNPLNDASLTVGFQGVGAIVDLSVATKVSGTYTVPLFQSETPVGISGPGFQVGIVFGIDLVIGITGEIDTQGGFQVAVADGSSFTIQFDPKEGNSAKFDGTSASLLPLSVTAPANITVSLRLRVQGGVELTSSPLLEAKALAGAYINIPEVILGEQFSLPPPNGSNCILPATAEININAGVYVDIGADIGDITLGDYNPTLSTTLFGAATSTCFVTVGAATTTTAATVTGTGAAVTTPACASPLVTSTATTTSTYSITSCAAAVANCPTSLAQVIIVTDTVTLTASSCPAALSVAPYANATLSYAAIPLTSLVDPVTNSLSVDSSVATPEAASITGSPRATATATSSV